jgi:hypothetical protein
MSQYLSNCDEEGVPGWKMMQWFTKVLNFLNHHFPSPRVIWFNRLVGDETEIFTYYIMQVQATRLL